MPHTVVCFQSICEVSMALGIMSANGNCCVPVLLVVLCEASRTGALWTLGSAKS